jgi:hypothetical protein
MTSAATRVFAAATTVISAVGLLAVTAPARAVPIIPLAFNCAHPIFNGPFNLRQANGYRVEMNLNGDSVDGQAVGIDTNNSRTNGRVHANTLGGAVILDIYWDSGSHGVYFGNWDDNGFVHGTSYDADRPPAKTSWDSETPLGCAAPPQPDTFAAISYSPPDHMVGFARGYPNQDAATAAASDRCAEDGELCRIVGTVQNGCIAIAIMDTGPYNVGTGATDREATDKAFGGLPPVRGTPAGQSFCSGQDVPGAVSGTRLQLPQAAITLRYDPPTVFGIRAWVGITNNSKPNPVACTYNDGVNPPRPFTVTGSAETPIDIAGIPTGTVYNVTVTCDGGLTHSEQKQF